MRKATKHAAAAAATSATATARAAAPTVVTFVPVGALRASASNPRQRVDAEELRALADSIQAQGILQPLIVRRRTGAALHGHKRPGLVQEDYFEVVAGERRWRAALLAGLEVVPALVRTLTDEQVLEIQVVENLQRAGVHPLDEAQGFAELIERHRYTAESVAAKIGKPPAYVHAALKLLRLPEGGARDAFRSGKLPRETAVLIGRIPSAKLRAQAAQAIVAPEGWQYAEDGTRAGEALSFRDAKALIERKFMLELKGAPFDRTALDLVPAAGSCTACPKLAGNNRAEYPEGRADVCTDPECYRAKCSAQSAGQHARLKREGYTMLPRATAKALFTSLDHALKADSGYLELTERVAADPQQRTLKAICGAALDGHVVCAIDRKGKPRLLVAHAAAAQALKAKGIVLKQPPAKPDRADWQGRQAARQAEQADRAQQLQRFLDHAFARGLALFAEVDTGRSDNGALADLVALCLENERCAVGGFAVLADEKLAASLGLVKGAGSKRLERLPPVRLLALLLRCELAMIHDQWSFELEDKDIQAAARTWGINLDAVRDGAAPEMLDLS